VADVVQAIQAASGDSDWTLAGFADDSAPRGEAGERLKRRGLRVVATVAEVSRPGVEVVVALGDPVLRALLTQKLLAGGASLAPALVHPSVTMGADVELAEGVVVAAGSQLTTNIRLGRGAQVNVGCSLSHDVVLGPQATLSPGCRLTGGVTVGEGAFFGVGAVVAPLVEVGDWAAVGAGSVVLHDVEPSSTVVGAPARPSSSP